jgi:Flp pilus assembly protein TadD
MARKWYRRAVEFSPKGLAHAVKNLSQQGKVGEAVQLCIDAIATDPSPPAAALLASILASHQANSEDQERAEPHLREVLRVHADDPQVNLAIATLRFTQGRAGEAVELYKKVLDQQPSNVVVLNNLAAILGEQPGMSSEALGYIERAIELAGSDPNLLDTKAMILFHSGSPENAIPLLEEVTARPAADPRFHFHLAAAYLAVGKHEEARVAFAKSRPDQLEARLHILTNRDRDLFRQLKREFDASSARPTNGSTREET